MGVVSGGNHNTSGGSSSSSSAAADALALLLREDPRLVELQMTSFYNGRLDESSRESSSKKHDDANKSKTYYSLVSPNEEAAFAYAAALMNEEEEHGWMTPSPATGDQGTNTSGTGDVQSRAQEALAEVDRKLAMVSGLAERLVRDYPEGVSETLLKLHGCSLDNEDTSGGHLKRQSSTASQRSATSNPQDEAKESETKEEGDDYNDESEEGKQGSSPSKINTTTLLHMRDKCERLHRQADMLEGVANRVEGSLEKQYRKLVICTTKLKRVLALSSTLKMAMRLQFESKKILGYGGLLRDLMESSGGGGAASSSISGGGRSGSMLDVDLRDLTRAASSVATMEQLLADPELHGAGASASSDEETELVEVVEAMRPEVEKAALAVRRLAASLLEEQQSLHGASTSISRLGGILQIYFHLQELPQAVWSAVESSLSMGEKAAAQCFNPKRMGLLREQAKQQAKDALEAELLEQHVASGGDGDSGTTTSPMAAQRKKKQQEQQLERYVAKKLKEQRTELAHRWSNAVGEATQQIATLQRVLALKSDPVSRQSFLQVVTTSGNVPEAFLPAQLYLEECGNTGGTSRGLSSLGKKQRQSQQQPIHILHLFWTQLSLSLGNRMSRLLRFEAGRLKNDVAALYPMLRAATLDMLHELGVGDSTTFGSTSSSGSSVPMTLPFKMEDDAVGGSHLSYHTSMSHSSGILGGSALLDQHTTTAGGGCSWTSSNMISLSSSSDPHSHHHSNHPHSSTPRISADSWTVDPYYSDYQVSTSFLEPFNDATNKDGGKGSSNMFLFGSSTIGSGSTSTRSTNAATAGSGSRSGNATATATTSSSSAALMRFEWKIFMGEYGPSRSIGSTSDNNASTTGNKITTTTTSIGLWDLQNAFVETSRDRLCSTLSQLFLMPEPTIDTLVGLDAATDGIGGFTTASSATGVTGSGLRGSNSSNVILPTLPTRYDLAKLESLMKDELALADPRQGGGEFGMIHLLSDQVVTMVIQFCSKAQNATSFNYCGTSGGASSSPSASSMMMGGDGGDIITTYYLRDDDWGPTELLSHDIKLAGVMSALSHAVVSAPDQTFLGPYRPSQSPPAQNEEASRLCRMALAPAVTSIDGLVKKSIVHPLCRAINQRLSKAFSKMHLGVYMEDNNNSSMSEGAIAASATTTFVQSHLAVLYDRIATQHLTKLPPEYASKVANTVCAYSMYAFVSNLALVRPLGEMGRLKMTQDLADLELSLEQLVLTANSGGGSTTSGSGTTSGSSGWMGMLGGGAGTTGSNPFAAAASASAMGTSGGGGSPLGQIDGGKPYLELRAVRSMLFWNGLDEEGLKSSNDIAMELLDEDWMKDVRPSTVLHFLFSSAAPDLLSSPHHSKRMSAQDYVNTLVRYDGTVDDGEANAWMTTMACCDAYQQRESIEGRQTSNSGRGTNAKGDRRIAAVLMALGSELLRRRRH